MKTIIPLIILCVLSAGTALASGAKPPTPPKEPPAAQGYIKGQPSNRSQDKGLKELEREEQAQNKTPPPKTPPPTPPARNGKGKTGTAQ